MTKTQREFENLNRRLGRIEKRFDIVDSDRSILEDVVARLAAVEEQLKLSVRHDNAVKKDIKEEIQIANDRIVAKVETKVDEATDAAKEIKDTIETKKVIQVKKKSFWKFW